MQASKTLSGKLLKKAYQNVLLLSYKHICDIDAQRNKVIVLINNEIPS